MLRVQVWNGYAQGRENEPQVAETVYSQSPPPSDVTSSSKVVSPEPPQTAQPTRERSIVQMLKTMGDHF